MGQPQLIEQPSAGINPRAHWPEELQQEFNAAGSNGIVGSVLVSETDRLRVWHLRLAPGMRCNFHKHVLNYFWSCHSHGKARGWYDDGRIQDVVHTPGETNHTDLLFTTVEFKDSPNTPLAIPDKYRLPDAV